MLGKCTLPRPSHSLLFVVFQFLDFRARTLTDSEEIQPSVIHFEGFLACTEFMVHVTGLLGCPLPVRTFNGPQAPRNTLNQQ